MSIFDKIYDDLKGVIGWVILGVLGFLAFMLGFFNWIIENKGIASAVFFVIGLIGFSFLFKKQFGVAFFLMAIAWVGIYFFDSGGRTYNITLSNGNVIRKAYDLEFRTPFNKTNAQNPTVKLYNRDGTIEYKWDEIRELRVDQYIIDDNGEKIYGNTSFKKLDFLLDMRNDRHKYIETIAYKVKKGSREANDDVLERNVVAIKLVDD